MTMAHERDPRAEPDTEDDSGDSLDRVATFEPEYDAIRKDRSDLTPPNELEGSDD